jgi:hypothetical protein
MTPFEEGVDAAKSRRHFSDCPYLFYRCAPGQFDRFKMDQWFFGWKMQLDKEGFGFNFQPIRGRHAPIRAQQEAKG